MVSAGRPQRGALPGRGKPASARRGPLRALLLACVAVALLAGIAGGLMRVGVVLPGAATSPWLQRAALAHAALMICGFMGTVIGIERAVAARQRTAWLAPLASGGAAIALLGGAQQLGGALLA